MRYLKCNNVMKKLISMCLILCFIAGMVPVYASDASETVEADKPVLIYINKDFEKQKEGEKPYGFLDGANAKVVTMPKADNPENKAAALLGSSTTEGTTSHSMYAAPVYKNFVISMRFMLGDTENEKSIAMRHDNTVANNATYIKGGTHYKFLSITDKITVNNKDFYTGLKADTWYKMDMAFDLENNKLQMLIDDKDCGSVNLYQTVKTVDIILLNHSTVDGSDWYIDDYRTYISDTVLSDAEYLSDLAEYEASGLMPPERFETAMQYDVNEFMFQTLYDEFVMLVGGIRFWKDNKYHTLPAPLREEDGVVVVPMRAFAESFGAEVNWSPDGTVINYNGNALRVVPGNETYWINGRPSKLYHPITVEKGITFIQLDVLTNFFEVDYVRQGDLISFTGDVECIYDWSPKLDNPTKDTDYIGLPANVMKQITNSLTFLRPTPEDIKKAFAETNPDDRHPRLLFTDWDEVKANMEKEPAYKAGVERMINIADSYFEEEPVVYNLYDGLRGKFPQQILDRGRNLSFAYKITGDEKYKDRLWDEVQVIYDTFPDFNPGHALDPGNSAHGMAYIYDWMYDVWNEEELSKVEAIIERNVIPHFASACRSASPIYKSGAYASFLNLGNSGNQPVVIMAGGLAAATAYYDKDPDLCADMISLMIQGIENSCLDFAPDGGWEEGGSYWVYTTNSLPVLINNLISALGTDFSICESPGLMETAYFPVSLQGSKESFKAGDDSGVGKTHAYQLFVARQTDDYALAKFYKENNKSYDIITLSSYIFDTEIEAAGAVDTEMEKDYFFNGLQQVTMRSGLDKTDTAVFFHGGTNTDGHGHTDSGSFQLDMLGERWAGRIGHESYNLVNFGSATGGGEYQDFNIMAQYYRNKGESKNQVIANYGSIYGDLAKEGEAKVVKQLHTDTGAYAIMNLTTNNPVYECGLRGIMLNRTTGEVVVEDDYRATEEADFWWMMTTDAEIELSDDGKSAVLTKNNQRIWVSIINGCDEIFEVIEQKPLSVLYPEIYGHVLTPEVQTPVEEQFKRLAIHNPKTDHFNVSVAFSPLGSTETEPAIKPEYMPMARWKLDDNATRGRLDGVTVNGEPLAGFKPDKYSYNINVISEKTEIPEIAYTVSDKYEVVVQNAETIPGTTTIVLKTDGYVVGRYSFVITPLNNTATFLNDKQLPVQEFWASSEPQPDNAALNLFDGKLSTKYATDEYSGNVIVDYGAVHTISEVKMAFTNGNKRTENFKIEYSVDGNNWIVAYEGTNSGTTLDHESYDMKNVSARYIKVSFFGNSQATTWVSVAELCAFTN